MILRTLALRKAPWAGLLSPCRNPAASRTARLPQAPRDPRGATRSACCASWCS